MIGRCYDKENSNYPYYGARGVNVSDEWLVFEKYFDDVTNMDSYNEEKVLKCEIVLDKDILSRESKKYSKETCMWTTWSDNQHEMNSQRKVVQQDIIAISPHGDEIHIYNIKKFAEETGLDRSCISKVLKGKRNQHNGWQFKYKEE